MILKSKSVFKGLGIAIMSFGGISFTVNMLYFSNFLNVNSFFNASIILTGAILFFVARKFLK